MILIHMSIYHRFIILTTQLFSYLNQYIKTFIDSQIYLVWFGFMAYQPLLVI